MAGLRDLIFLSLKYIPGPLTSRSQISCSRSRVPRGTDLSERPGARDLAPGSHRQGALEPPEPRSGRVRSAAMAPVGKKRQTARGTAGRTQARKPHRSPPQRAPPNTQTWTCGRRSGSAASQGSGFRCYLRHLRASHSPAAVCGSGCTSGASPKGEGRKEKKKVWHEPGCFTTAGFLPSCIF